MRLQFGGFRAVVMHPHVVHRQARALLDAQLEWQGQATGASFGELEGRRCHRAAAIGGGGAAVAGAAHLAGGCGIRALGQRVEGEAFVLGLLAFLAFGVFFGHSVGQLKGEGG